MGPRDEATTDPAGCGKRHILIGSCGDGANRMWTSCRTLGSEEFDVTIYGAVSQLESDISSFDLAILDADTNETELDCWLERLGAASHQLPIVLATSNFTGANVLYLASRGDLVLPKPLDAETLSAAAGWLLGRDDPVGRFAQRYKLSPRETSLVRLSLAGLNNDEAAASLGCSRHTISTYWNRVARKTGVSGQRDILILLFRDGQGVRRPLSRSFDGTWTSR